MKKLNFHIYGEEWTHFSWWNSKIDLFQMVSWFMLVYGVPLKHFQSWKSLNCGMMKKIHSKMKNLKWYINGEKLIQLKQIQSWKPLKCKRSKRLATRWKKKSNIIWGISDSSFRNEFFYLYHFNGFYVWFHFIGTP